MKNHQMVTKLYTSATKNILLGVPIILLFAVRGVDIDISDRFNIHSAKVLAQTPSKIAAKSSLASQIIITEVLYHETGQGASGNDEFIEIYNTSSSAVNLSGWKLGNSNLIANVKDSTGGITGNASSPAYIFPKDTVLRPKEYAVIWIGNNTPHHQADDAAWQIWLGQRPKLNNDGDDIWLYDERSQIVDYIAYGAGLAIDTLPAASLNLWNNTYQSSLTTDKGQSISLANIVSDLNSSACWEPTNSARKSISSIASNRCPNYTKPVDTDDRGNTLTSAGKSNYNIALNPSPSPQPQATATPTSTPQPSPETAATSTPQSSSSVITASNI
ncbi:lamin tail domain-containing protein [Aliterella atlantica]|uniref:LTD domain-containing protein n=1 Tax=Aliterella atlantica CENA595 TaxID=1618023 RepID=A0A0D8ZPU1_9CYAN|nr:lamin tail domain-containing protein [Aliterella atlantica]KJH70534.1 hypothetical protein UH38_17330 [Aliterella atlantica CENA595]